LASSDFIWKDNANPQQQNSKPFGEPMSNSRVLKEKPKDSVKETYSPALATDYTVQGGDSWVGLARKIGLVDPWDLIDFNFPGIKEVRAKDAQLASRQVNWQLAEYVGCENRPTPSIWRFPRV
jgi:hypothetical protein